MAITASEWDSLIPQARLAGLLPRIEILVAERGLENRIPKTVKPHLQSASVVATHEARLMLFELERIERALARIDTPVILLKGTAYLLAKLPNSRGRLSSDIDLLVPKDKLTDVENALLRHGWEHVKLEEYDQYYYRTWSHELPPLRHRVRGTLVDVHHTILPPAGRLRPDVDKLWAKARSLEGTTFKILAPSDMVLHAAAHAFQDGDLRHGIRDLVDIDELLRHFGARADFWEDLIARAAELNLTRPIYYALRYSNRYFQTPVPPVLLAKTERWKPRWPAHLVMDRLVALVLAAGPHLGSFSRSACLLLYLRSHWLRMPPMLLVRHFAHKCIKEWRWLPNPS
jgi:hypothetical protein